MSVQAAATIDQALPSQASSDSVLDQKMRTRPGRWARAAFIAALLGGFTYAIMQLVSDLSEVHSPTAFPFVILGVALLVALGFESEG